MEHGQHAAVMAGLHDDIRALATDLGRMPTSNELRRFLAKRGVGREATADLADSAAPKDALRGRDAPMGNWEPAPVGRRRPPRQVAPSTPSHRTREEDEDLVAREGRQSPSVSCVPTPPEGMSICGDNSGSRFDYGMLPETGLTVHADESAVSDTESQPEPPADSVVARAVDDLVDDWHRAGGNLHYDQVVALATKRSLGAAQQASVVAMLGRVGVEITGPGKVTDPSHAQAEDDEPAQSQQGKDLLKVYFEEVARHPLIWAEDEVRLGRLIHAGLAAEETLADSEQIAPLFRSERAALRAAIRAGKEAHADLVQANLRLVISVAKSSKYFYSGLDLADRIQDGNLGLLRAATKFDHTLGFKFSTYAMWWIRQGIERGIADKGRVIRLPVHLHEKASKLRRTKAALSRRWDRDPTIFELADATGFTAGAVQAILEQSQSIRSLDMPLGTDGDLTLGDLLSSDADIDGRNDPVECVLNSACQRDLENVLANVLTSREEDILVRRYDLAEAGTQTLDEIGAVYGVTRERIRQLEGVAMDKIRDSETARSLFEYLVDQARTDEPKPRAGWPVPTGKFGKFRPVAKVKKMQGA